MKKEWKSNNYNNVRQIVEAHTHMSAEEFLYPQKDPYLHGLKEAVQFVKLKLRHKVPVHIVGDYDVDGEMSTAILELALETFGGYPVHVRLPRRFSEGYGLSMKIIDEISDGLIITVDNGIAALEQVKAAKAKGLSVVVIDHHLPVRNPDTEEIILPEADYVIDPKAIEGSMFSEYCGAGLAYRFAKALLTEEHPIMNNLLVFASIATVTDMVPLIGDNRTIVKEGLKHINQRDVTFGLQILLDRLKLNHVTEEDYGFLIGPVMNASGRMLDDGPIDVVNMVTSLADPANPEFIRKTMYLQDLADELVERNEKRKEAVEKDLIEAENIIRKKTLMNNNPLIVYSSNFWEGTIGILAGKLAEKYQVPCLVFTKSSAKGIAKGSGRTYGNIHLKYLLDKASDLLVGYLFFKEVGKHTVYKVVHPEHIEIYSIVRPRNKEKGKEEDFFEIIKLIPDYMDMRFFMPNNMDQFYFKSEMKTKGIVSCEKFRKAQITDKQINEIEDVGFFMQLIDPKKHSAFILIPSKNFFTPFCRKLGIGKVNYGIDPIRDIYLASRLKDANPFVIVYRTNDPATYGKAFTCFSEKTVKIEQSCIFDYKDALAKIEPNIIRSWQYTHTRTDIDFSYPARSINLKQKCKITLGTRLSFSDIGECAFRLQNCIFTNGGTILLPQEASRKKSNKLSPEGIVKDYNSQCYMKFDKIMEQLKSYETIPVTDMQQSVWNILEKLKFSSAFGFSNTRDLQKNYLSTFEKEGDALDVVIKILKIPGVLQRNYPGTTHDRVNECIGKIFNLKMEKLIV